MARFSSLLVASLCVVLIVLSSTASAQQEEEYPIQAVPQNTGIIERIMTDYVYPIRDYDWRGMLWRALNGVMDYMAPDTKEPKVGGPHHFAQDRTAVLVRRMLNRAMHYVESFMA